MTESAAISTAEPQYSRSSHRFKIWGGIAIIFISGIIVGVIGVKLMVRAYIEQLTAQGPSAITDLLTGLIDDELSLSEAQSAKVWEVINRTQGKMYVVRRSIRVPMRQAAREAMTEIDAELSPEQKEKFKPAFGLVEQNFQRTDAYWEKQGFAPGESQAATEAQVPTTPDTPVETDTSSGIGAPQ